MMQAMRLSDIAQPLRGSLRGADAPFDAVVTDSREARAGQLFVALKGERFDAHDYLDDAAKGGAAGAVVSRLGPCPLPAVQVADTREALGRLGALNRSFYRGPLAAITGSCGKTTTRALLAAILSRCGPTLATSGNLNNEIGAPLTLLELRPKHRYAAVEMGAAAAGDIAYLCELARPTVAVLLNAMPAHLEGFGSVAAVAEAKGEILTGLGGRGTAVFNADSDYAGLWRGLARAEGKAGAERILTFGLSRYAQVRAAGLSAGADGAYSFQLQARLPGGKAEAEVRLRLPGRHNVLNALAAAAAAFAMDADLAAVAAGLQSAEPVAGRGRSRRLDSGAALIDDSYNANPGSVLAAIDALAARPGRRTLVLGAMAELGPGSAAFHAEMGRAAKTAGLERLWAVGGGDAGASVAAFGDGGRLFADKPALIDALRGDLGSEDCVLVKGSRCAGMDEVVSFFPPARPDAPAADAPASASSGAYAPAPISASATTEEG